MRRPGNWMAALNIISFFLGCFAAAIWMDAGDKQKPSANEPEIASLQTVKVLVAKSDLPQHKALRDNPGDFFVAKECALGDVPKDALKADELAKLQGKFLNRKLGKGHCITMEDVAADSNLTFVEIQAEPGPYGIRIDGLPGRDVAIIWTGYSDKHGQVISKMLVEYVKVLKASPCPGFDDALHSKFHALVAVTPAEEAELVQSMKNGVLRLSLQNRDKVQYIEQYTLNDLLKPRKKAPIGDLSKEDAHKHSLPKGIRAVGLPLDIDVSDGSYRPGSRVDIIWVGIAEGTSKLSTKILLQDVMVLDATCAGMNQGDPTKRYPCVITVAIMADDVMPLILAMETGRLTVIRHEDNATTPPAKTGKD